MSAPGGDGGTARHSVHVATGILASRVLGLVRQKVFLYFLGTSAAADAFNAAFRIPNILQNLLGEGVLSASFIPAYVRLRASGDEQGSRDLAGAVLGLLLLVASLAVLVGILAAPWLVDLIAMGFDEERKALTVRLVRVLFPGAGLLVVSAWCLGVLNSHRRFLLSYASPAAWNAAMIATLLFGGGRTDGPSLVVWLAWGSVAGSALQVLVQWPAVRSLLAGVRVRWGAAATEARGVVRDMGPVVVGRGALQLAAYVDGFIASWLVTGSMTILGNAQALYMLPVSLFGMSVSAAELPAMATDGATGAVADERLRARLDRGLWRVSFFVVPSAVAMMTIGDALGTILFRGGLFGAAEVVWLWGALAAAAVGLLASAAGRLYGSALYALRDARTPPRIAVVRVVVGAALGSTGALWVGPRLGLPATWGVPLLLLGSSVAAWAEFLLLRGSVRRRIGVGSGGRVALARLTMVTGAAAASAAATLGLRAAGVDFRSFVGAGAAILAFSATYAATALWMRIDEAMALRDAVARRWRWRWR